MSKFLNISLPVENENNIHLVDYKDQSRADLTLICEGKHSAMKKELGEKRLVTGEGRSLLPADLEAPEHKNIERRNMLGGRPQLPEIYKDGGDVDAESVFFPKSKE